MLYFCKTRTDRSFRVASRHMGHRRDTNNVRGRTWGMLLPLPNREWMARYLNNRPSRQHIYTLPLSTKSSDTMEHTFSVWYYIQYAANTKPTETLAFSLSWFWLSSLDNWSMRYVFFSKPVNPFPQGLMMQILIYCAKWWSNLWQNAFIVKCDTLVVPRLFAIDFSFQRR